MRTIPEVESCIVDGLSRPLPGVEAQLLLAPRPRHGWSPDFLPPGLRSGAALLLVYPRDGVPSILLTLRHSGLPHHAGQVSLPGGAVEPGETPEQAALREAEEEVGVRACDVRVLGTLTPLHIPVSKFLLVPVVAVSATELRFHAHAPEVEAVLEPSLADLGSASVVGLERRGSGEAAFEVPFLLVEGQRVWGATAMVLAEFLALVGLPPTVSPQRTP